MRDTNYIIEKIVSKPESINIVREEIVRITEDKPLRLVHCEYNIFGRNGFVDKQQVTITDEDYDLLMSSSPNFAPNKPENEYREIDLWYVLDLIRSRGNKE